MRLPGRIALSIALLGLVSFGPHAAHAGNAVAAERASEQPTAAATAPTPTPPGLRLPGLVRPTGYRASLTIDPADDGFGGEIEIALDVRTATDLIWLHADRLEITAARLLSGKDSIAATTSVSGTDLLAVRLAAPAPVGPATLKIAYRGLLDLTDTHGLFKQKEGGDWYVFSQFESTSARRAFPCFDEPSPKVPWQLTLTVPRDLVAASNTPIEKESKAAGKMRTVTFAPTPPLPTYLVALAVGPFDRVDGGTMGTNKTPLRILTPRGRGAEAAYAVAITPELFTRLERYFGSPYPFAKLDEVAIPQTVSFGAMENPGLVTYSQSGLLAKQGEMSINQRRRLAGTTAHEIAHMWFGNLVTMKYWDDIWLNEGFATWMADKVVAEWKPEWDRDVSRVQSRSRAMSADSLVSARKVRQPIASAGDIDNAFDGITYSKGAATLTMFESWVGADPFRAGVNRYLAQHARGNADSDDFLAALAAASRPEIVPAFKSFLDQPGVPLVTVALICTDGAPARVRLEQRRFLPTGSHGSADASWMIPVCLRYRRGEQEARSCTLLTKASDEVPLDPALGCPDWLLGNDGMAGYYRTSYARDSGDLLARLLADGGKHLTLPERIGLLGDVSALVSAGELEMAEALRYVPRFARDDNRHVVASVARIAGGLGDDLVPNDLRPSYARFVQEMFGVRARALALVPRPDEDDETRLMRDTLVGLVADQGEDAPLRAEAVRLAGRWIDDNAAIDPDLVGTVLDIATISGDATLFDRLLAAAKKEEDRRRRGRLLSALGSFRDPALAKRALGLVLGDEFHPRESMSVLRGAFASPDTRDVAWSFFKENFAAIVARIPSESRANLPRMAGGFCDPAHRAEAESFFSGRIADIPGAERPLRQTLERMDLCIASKAAQLPSVRGFLAGW